MTYFLRLTTGLVVCALAALGCNGEENGGDEPRPLVFAHGCPPPPFVGAEDAGIFTGDTTGGEGIVDFFAARDYTDDLLRVFLFPDLTCPPNFEYADRLGDYVQEVLADTGSDKVDMLGFSMGAVAGRIFLRQGGTEFVEDFVSMAGAGHGSVLAGMVGEAGQEMLGAPNYQGALEVSPPYACEGESTEADVQFFLNGCLTADGRTVDEDETPEDVDEGGHVRYLSVWNDQDDLVIPVEAACLNQKFQNDCSDPVNMQVSVAAVTEVKPGTNIYSSHVETQLDESVRQAVYDFFRPTRE